MDIPTYIQNHDAVVRFFGCWPSFHDANVVAFELLEGSDSIRLMLHTWLMTDEVDVNGHFVLRDHALVSFRFAHLHDVEMDAFRSGNILFGMKILKRAELDLFHVELESVMDMSGSFSARSGEVLSVVPCTSNGFEL